MVEKLRCAVIGVGGIGLDHLNSLIHTHRAAAVAISEINTVRAREAMERYKIPRNYADYHDLLDQPDIDAVIIALPNHLHARVAIDALKARKHVLLEKPMATNAKDAARILETAKNAKRVLMVAQNFRFNRHAQLVRQIVQRGELGEIYHGRAFWLRRSGIPRIGSWFTQKQQAGGGCAYDIGVHMLDLCLHLMGDFEAESVSASMAAKFGPRGLGEYEWGRSEIDPAKLFDVEDFCSAFIRLKSGRTVILEVAWAGHFSPDIREQGVDLLGTSGGASLFPGRFYRPGPNGYECTLLSAPKVPYPEDRVHHFVQCVLEDKKPLVQPEESLKVQQILDAVYASAASGREVQVK
jgi:predicted dehydrogenase